jgi:hypothetical protein
MDVLDQNCFVSIGIMSSVSFMALAPGYPLDKDDLCQVLGQRVTRTGQQNRKTISGLSFSFAIWAPNGTEIILINFGVQRSGVLDNEIAKLILGSFSHKVYIYGLYVGRR